MKKEHLRYINLSNIKKKNRNNGNKRVELLLGFNFFFFSFSFSTVSQQTRNRFNEFSHNSYHLYNLGAFQIISGLQNFDRDNVASVVTAADKVGTIFGLHLFYGFAMKMCEKISLISWFSGVWFNIDFFYLTPCRTEKLAMWEIGSYCIFRIKYCSHLSSGNENQVVKVTGHMFGYCLGMDWFMFSKTVSILKNKENNEN